MNILQEKTPDFDTWRDVFTCNGWIIKENILQNLRASDICRNIGFMLNILRYECCKDNAKKKIFQAKHEFKFILTKNIDLKIPVSKSQNTEPCK